MARPAGQRAAAGERAGSGRADPFVFPAGARSGGEGAAGRAPGVPGWAVFVREGGRMRQVLGAEGQCRGRAARGGEPCLGGRAQGRGAGGFRTRGLCPVVRAGAFGVTGVFGVTGEGGRSESSGRAGQWAQSRSARSGDAAGARRVSGPGGQSGLRMTGLRMRMLGGVAVSAVNG